MKKLIFDCLRENSLMWYFIKMLKLKKNLLRDVTIDQWINAFIKRFKKQDVVAL